MQTPFFPAFRPQLAPCRQRAAQQIRQATLAQLEHYLRGVMPPHLLAQEDEGDNKPHKRRETDKAIFDSVSPNGSDGPD